MTRVLAELVNVPKPKCHRSDANFWGHQDLVYKKPLPLSGEIDCRKVVNLYNRPSMTEAQRAEKQKQFRRNLALGNYSLLSNVVLPTEEELDVPPLLSQGTPAPYLYFSDPLVLDPDLLDDDLSIAARPLQGLFNSYPSDDEKSD